ncbi:MAG: ATP-dependent sacrificial sulfur transferase LarE [Methanobacterium sp.]
MDLEINLNKIRNYLKDKRIVIAFSGGADSTLLAKLAVDSSLEAVAVTVDNGVLPRDCIVNAKRIAENISIPHHVLKENYLTDESFSSNPPQRCYICKNKMYDKLEEFANSKNFENIADGTNISDLLDDRPGIMVNYQKKILTPLVYGGMTAEDVHNALKKFNLEYSPSTTCYGTRIPTGSEITPKKINRIKYAETLIKNITGDEVVRVRDDGGARIEVSNVDSLLNNEILMHISSELNAVGFKKVLLDVTGYGGPKKDIVIYKPCKDEANKIMFETELPFEINIQDTCKEMKELGEEVKCSIQMGVIMMEFGGRNVTIFRKGKIVARRVKNKEDARDLMVEVLPLIRRVI